jgi:hypothetical protein
MNFKTTVILLVLLVGALTFFIVANRSDEGEEDPAKVARKDAENEKGRRLFDVAAVDVSKMVIRPGPGAPAGAKLVELSKADGQWQLVQPISTPADSFEGRNLVEAIADVRSTGSIDLDDANRGNTGLAKPRYVVELTDAKGKVHKLTVGDRSALGHLYVATGDDTKTASLVTGGPLGERLGRGTTDKLVAAVRDKLVVRGVGAFDAKQIEIERGAGACGRRCRRAGGRKLTLHKAGADWRLVSPADVPADTAEVSDILSTLTNLRAEEFTDEATAGSSGASFDRPRATVTVSTAAPAPSRRRRVARPNRRDAAGHRAGRQGGHGGDRAGRRHRGGEELGEGDGPGQPVGPGDGRPGGARQAELREDRGRLAADAPGPQGVRRRPRAGVGGDDRPRGGRRDATRHDPACRRDSAGRTGGYSAGPPQGEHRARPAVAEAGRWRGGDSAGGRATRRHATRHRATRRHPAGD